MKLRAIAVIAAAVAIILLLAAGPGTRMGLWHFRTGLGLLRWAAWVGIAGILVTLVALVATRPRGGHLAMLLIALGASGAAVVFPWRMAQQARRVPPIHDITTDTQDPPGFVAVPAERGPDANPVAYGGDSVAVLQRQAYPDIQPLHLNAPPESAFGRALTAARSMRWQIVAADTAAGRIEATATTPWFGFRDDVVIRIRAENGGSRVDVRSISRVGRSDLGANAARVRDFLARLASAGV